MNRSVTGSVIALLPEGIEIPAGISDIESFRAWVKSDSFPERGRIDWVAGRLEVDMSPEDLNTHGTPKSAISAQLEVVPVPAVDGEVAIDARYLEDAEAFTEDDQGGIGEVCWKVGVLFQDFQYLTIS